MAGIGVNNTYIKADNTPVLNASKGQVTGTPDDIKRVQTALNAAGANLDVDGIWGKKTQDAFQKYGNSALYRSRTDNGVSYGVVNTGNSANWFGTEANRQALNNKHLEADGLTSDEQPVHNIGSAVDLDAFRNKYGQYGMDGTGGVFNKSGFSSNPYYLQSVAGITRNMTNGTALESLSDKAIQRMVESAAPWMNSSYIDPVSGVISSVQGKGMVSLGDVRKAYADMTNQKTEYASGAGRIAAPFATPDYYDGTILNSDLGSKQQDIINQNLSATSGSIPVIGVGAGRWNPNSAAYPTPADNATHNSTPATTTGNTSITTPANTKPAEMTDEEWLKYVAALSGLEGW